MEKMTLHRALSELKLIDSKIEKATSEILPVGWKQEGKLVNGVMQEEEFTRLAKSRYDSVIDLLNRKKEIKSAIVAANAKTQVRIGDKTMSIADAITMKAGMALKKKFVEVLKSRYNGTLGSINKNNELVNQNLQRILEAAMGKDNVKTNKEDVDAISKPYLTSNQFSLFDPLEIGKKIEELEREITSFESEVDATLSEANATTFIFSEQ